MAIKVTARCSECECTHFTKLNEDTQDIVCPNCSRRMQSLTREEFDEVNTIVKKQLFCGILSIVFFILTAVCLVLWMGSPGTWVTGDKQPSPDATASFFMGGVICALIALVLGILGSRKRYVVEF